MEENKNNNEVTKNEGKQINFTLSANMLFLLIPIAILATFMVYSIVLAFGGYNNVVHGIMSIVFLSVSLGGLGLSVLKFKTLNLEVALSMLVTLIIFLNF